ncbi:MAG: gamma-glutamylcyclotransferase family protein [Candidatus Promineifilaceae bacterium]|jgi:gamma-glutamylcyclotransferase (GGCT)/AIG2-like uncharacterized protein YtfP
MNSQATTQPLPFFVYGTLMIGQPNDYKWRDCIQSFESAFIKDCRLFDFGYYPIMTNGDGGSVVGQIINLKKECYIQILQDLDFLEGFDPDHPENSNFLRIRARVVTTAGGELEAWTYVGKGSKVQNLLPIESGDWAKHMTEKSEMITTWWKEITIVWDDFRRTTDSRQ